MSDSGETTLTFLLIQRCLFVVLKFHLHYLNKRLEHLCYACTMKMVVVDQVSWLKSKLIKLGAKWYPEPVGLQKHNPATCIVLIQYWICDRHYRPLGCPTGPVSNSHHITKSNESHILETLLSSSSG